MKELLAELDLTLVTPDDLGIRLEVEETGDTYRENAALKAEAWARASKMLTLADDSGIEVDALGGAPGVRSARYSESGSDADNVDLLLHNLASVPDEKRSARFVCVVAIAGPESETEFAEGRCEGEIIRERLGDSGFGYDPLFRVPELGLTMAQLPPEQKNVISHRARAAKSAVPIIKRRVQERSH